LEDANPPGRASPHFSQTLTGAGASASRRERIVAINKIAIHLRNVYIAVEAAARRRET